MDNTTASNVIPLPTSPRVLPRRSVIYDRTGPRYRVVVVDEVLHGQHLYVVVARHVWTDVITVVGPLSSQIDALKIARSQVHA